MPWALGTNESSEGLPPRGDVEERSNLRAKASAPTPCFAIRITVAVPPFSAMSDSLKTSAGPLQIPESKSLRSVGDRTIAKLSMLAAVAYKHGIGQPFVYLQINDFLRVMFSNLGEEHKFKIGSCVCSTTFRSGHRSIFRYQTQVIARHCRHLQSRAFPHRMSSGTGQHWPGRHEE